MSSRFLHSANAVLAASFLLLAFSSGADARRGAAPFSRNAAGGPLEAVEVYAVPQRDRAALIADADARQKEGSPFIYADPIAVSITPERHGTWESLPDGSRLWRLRIHAPGATDLNLGLTRYLLPPGATLHVISETADHYEGPYTYRDNKPHGELWLPVVPGPRAVLELFVPSEVKFPPELEIGQIGYGFRDWFRLGSEGLRQGSCNNDVVCRVGDPWRDEIAAVAVYSLNGFLTCSGTMVMNQTADFTPYFLTANHCGISSGNDQSMVVYWNFESPNCGDLCCGSLADNQTGATLRAKRTDVDFALVELDLDPDPASGVYFAGWDNSGIAPTGSVGIHHPGADEKAISFNFDPLTTMNSCIGSGGVNSHWRVNNWEDGTTEPGSSGSGLWDPVSHHLVGFLSGGLASCTTIDYDCYGKFAVAWDGASAASRLRDWLDPLGTGVSSVDGAFPDGVGSIKYVSHSGADSCASDPLNDNGFWEPGETVTVPVEVRASGGDHTNIVGVLSTTTPGVTILDDTATWPDLLSGSTSLSDAPHFKVQLDPTIACNTQIDFQVSVTSSQGGPFPLTFSDMVGEQLVAPGLPATIPDNDPAGVTSTLTVGSAVTLTDVNVRVDIQHTWVGDLKIELESPAGTRIVLLDRPGVPASTFGCGDDNMNVTFDDASGFALESYCAGTDPWYVGAAAPVQALSVFNGQSTAGAWKLIVSDNAGFDTGVIADWELITTPPVTGQCVVCQGGATGADLTGIGAEARSFTLFQNQPNPFTRHSEIRFNLPAGGHATLEVFDVTGRLVTTLLDRPLAAGRHAVLWDGTDGSAHPVAAGIYFYRLRSGSKAEIKRMSLVR